MKAKDYIIIGGAVALFLLWKNKQKTKQWTQQLKILSVLGEAELKFNTGRYDNRFVANQNAQQSILNLLRAYFRLS